MQGGSVINHVLNNPELSKKYEIRAITRDVNSEKAKQLKEKVTVVEGDISNAAIRLGHETPNIQCTHGGRALPSSKSGLVPRDAYLVSDRPLRDADYPSTNVGYFTFKRNDAGSH